MCEVEIALVLYLAQIQSGYATTPSLGPIARRAAVPGADVQYASLGVEGFDLGRHLLCRTPAGVEDGLLFVLVDLVTIKHLLERLPVTGLAEREHQQDTGFLRQQIIRDQIAMRLFLWCHNDAAARGT